MALDRNIVRLSIYQFLKSILFFLKKTDLLKLILFINPHFSILYVLVYIKVCIKHVVRFNFIILTVVERFVILT